MRILSLVFFLALLTSTGSIAQKKIAIIRIDSVPKVFLDSAMAVIELQYGEEVILLKPFQNIEFAKSTIDTVLCASCINEQVNNKYLFEYKKLILITGSPLSIYKNVHPNLVSKSLVRGFSSSVGGFSTTISLYKISLESKNWYEGMLNFKKVIAHELAHLYGLNHCDLHEGCLMVDGFSFEANSGLLCDSCMSKLNSIRVK